MYIYMYMIYIQIYIITLLKWLLLGCVFMGNFFLTSVYFLIFSITYSENIFPYSQKKKSSLFSWGSLLKSVNTKFI